MKMLIIYQVIYIFPLLYNKVTCQLLLKKENIIVPIGRNVYINPSDLQFFDDSKSYVCKVEVVSNEPMTQRVGLLEPQVFDCAFSPGTVKYVHHGSPLLLNDTVKMRAYKFLDDDTISEYFDLLIFVENTSYSIIQPVQPLKIKEFLGSTDPIDENILNFNYSRQEGAVCKVRLSRRILNKPTHGRIVLGKEKRTIDVIKRRCDDFLELGLRYEHLAPPSPNIDFILIIVEVTDPYMNSGDFFTEWYHIPVIIEPGFPNLPPKASFSGMYLMDVDQFIITAITPAVLSATDSETPSDELIFNISKPLLQHQGSIVHLSDHTRSISSFRQRDLNNFDIAYKPPARSFKDRQMFEIGFVICDPDFAYSDPFTMHIAIRPAVTSAPRVSLNVGMILLEGQSRPLRTNNLEIVDNDNIKDVIIYVTGGLHHGRLEVKRKPAVSFVQSDIVSGSVIYHHDDSDSVRDSIYLRIYDGSHSTNTKVPITIVPKDDSPPTLVVNIGFKVKEGGTVQITSSILRAVDLDTSDEFVTFWVSKPPLSGEIWRKYVWEREGVSVTNFTQGDINKGLIYYHHNGNEVFIDSFEIILKDINKEPNVSPPFKVSIRVMPVGDDPPKRDPASSFSLEVQEGGVGILGSQHLRFMDIDSQDQEILYSINSAPRFTGSFAHADPGKVVFISDENLLQKTLSLNPIKHFTQEQINHHKVAYIPPLDEIGPNPLYLQFIFSVKDKDNNVVPGQIFNITILPVNNKLPQLHTGELLVEEGSSTLLSTNELSVYDPDTLTSDLQISLFTIPLHGSLRRSEQPLRVGDLMSLDDILTLRLEYVHDGSESLKDGFKVGVNDGLHFVSGIVNVSIEPVDDENPIWHKNLLPRILTTEGGSVKITSEVIAATDVDTDDSSLYFILTEAPNHGYIKLNHHKVNRFMQKDIFSGEVEYVHNGLEIGPNPKEDSLTFIVSDKPFPHLKPHESHKISVTILPVNTKHPRLYFKRAILVEEGQTVVISEDNLSATDDDTFPAELLIVITKQPEYGFIENLRPTPGYEKTPGGNMISAFPLQDVKDGFIFFVQNRHRNTEPESDGFEVFVTDGIHNSTSILVYVSIILINDEIPNFHLNNITLNEGDKYIFDNESVVANDQDYPGDILIISVKKPPQYGVLTYFVQAVNDGKMIEIPFSQLSFENFDRMVYQHDGSENFVDFFTLSLNDGFHEELQTCYVTINPINDEPPELIKNVPAKNVEFQGAVILSGAYLLVKDKDTTEEEVTYTVVDLPRFGMIEKKEVDGSWVSLKSAVFSQADINKNIIRYKHNSGISSIYEDSFSFLVSDGAFDTPLSIFNIKLVDSGKNDFLVYNSGAYVKSGEKVVINTSLLYAKDNSSKIEEIYFKVLKPPLYGQLINYHNDSSHVKNFSIFDLANNLLYYKHNESAKVTSDYIEMIASNGVVSKNITFSITITGIAKKVPILEINLPLYINPLERRSKVITSQHLLSYQPMVESSKIIYEIVKPTRFGSIFYDGKIENPTIFSQEDIENELLTYSTFQNASLKDNFMFKVTNHEEEGFFLDGRLMLDPIMFLIYLNTSTSEPHLLINSPSELEKVWNDELGFFIHSYNLKATFSNSNASDIKFYVYKYLQYGFIFHLREQKVVRSFTQEDINEQLIAVILKHSSNTQDYFTFHIAIDKVTFQKEFRMDFQWAVVFFAFSEYPVCEDVVSLNIEIFRRGNINISSYVTVVSSEQTAKEGLDFISRRINKLQFDPGITSIIWKIMIVQDELEEAPIEQLQVTLSDPENCLISLNRTIVSIYDLDRGACSQIPVQGPPKNEIDLSKQIYLSFDSDQEVLDDKDDYDFSNVGFPTVCNQSITGLLHFQLSTQSLFQCDGKQWLPWVKKNSSLDADHFQSPYFGNKSVKDVTDSAMTTPVLFPETTPESDILIEYSCPEGWEKYQEKCHKWHKQPSTWNEAQSVCESYISGELVTVQSSDYNSWLLQLARGKPFWIGLHASTDSNEWMYKIPKDATYYNWKKGFPRFPGTTEMKHRCVLVRGSGHWINKNCDVHDHSYICSIPMKIGL